MPALVVHRTDDFLPVQLGREVAQLLPNAAFVEFPGTDHAIWFADFDPIIDEIPVMLPDDLRNKKEDLEFLTKWKDRLPKETVASGKPVNLS